MKPVDSDDLRTSYKTSHLSAWIRSLASLLALILFVQAVVSAICLLFAWLVNEPISTFSISLLSFFIGGLVLASFNSFRFSVTKWRAKELVLIWVVLIASGMLPYILSGEVPGPIDSFFESTSGYTATGTSLFGSLELIPRSIILWRSLTQWIGGLITLLSMVLIIPQLDFAGNRFPDSFLKEKVWTPNSYKSAPVLILLVYAILTGLQIIMLYLGKLSLFDSVCISFATVSSGSFLPHGGSLESYSTYIQYVVLLFIFLSGFSYFFYVLLLTRQRISTDSLQEIFGYLVFIFIITSFVIACLYLWVYPTFEAAFRCGLFQVVSLSSSSGLIASNYLLWPKQLILALFLVMIVGNLAGSTSGGIKFFRIRTVFKNFAQIFRQLPGYESKANSRLCAVPDTERYNIKILSFIIIWGIVTGGAIVLLIFDGLVPATAVPMALGAITTTGIQLPLVDVSGSGRLLLTVLMLLGRLEIYPFLIVLLSFFMKKQSEF